MCQKIIVISNQDCPGKSTQVADWSDLQTEILELIFRKLSFLDILHSRAVCSSWYCAARSYISSPRTQAPWLTLPSRLSFFSLAEKKFYNVNRWFYGAWSWCRGSSHGWLVIVDKEKKAHLFNPCTGARIQLPLFGKAIMEIRQQPTILVIKSILLSNPFYSKKFSVVVIYEYRGRRLAFCMHGDETWTDLDAVHGPYSDITCHDHHLYALSKRGSVEVWDFHDNFPKKTVVLEPAVETIDYVGNCPIAKFSSVNYVVVDSYKFATASYLVVDSSLGEFLLIKRFLAHLVTREGVIVEREEFHKDSSILTYKTVQFRVYKLDSNGKKWDRVESVGDRALFVGANETMSVSTREFPEFEENSIYFTDDKWTMMDGFFPLRDVQYGGHDNGVYNLRDGSIKAILMDEGDNIRIKPPPLWIVPNPW